MARFDIYDIKKQASYFLREKVKDARLALTDVSRIQLLTEEATNTDPWGPETRTMALLSHAAFELEEYGRIVQVLHNRLEPNVKRPWRQLYKTLIVLEYLVTHGPGSLSNEFRTDTVCIEELCLYNFIDQHGIDRGVNVRKQADRVLELLSKADLWKEERNRAQKISHGIHGFGSSIEPAHVVIESAEHHQTGSDVSEPEDPESQSLLSNESSKEESHVVTELSKESHVVTELSSTNSGVEWQPFEKCSSIPSYLRPSNESSPSQDDEWNPFKKSLSSPHFRNASHLRWQPFDISKRNDIGSHITEPKNETDSLSLQASNDGNKEGPLPDRFSGADLSEIPQLGKTRLPPHRSMKQFFGLHRPSKDLPEKDASEWSSTEEPSPHRSMRQLFGLHRSGKDLPAQDASEWSSTKEQQTGQEPVIAGSTLMNGSRGIDEFVVSEAEKLSQQSEAAQKCQCPSNVPVLPPPPRSEYSTKFQHHWKASSLV